jgi:CheY-like chemotaxis protein
MTVGDSGRLQQAVINLLSNAIKFTPESGKVDIVLRCRGNRAELIVSDTGIGIDPDFLPHVFNRFSQADSSTVRRYSGLGIGLALVRYLIELHGGTVSAASPGVGHGATFTAEMPTMQGKLTGMPDASDARSPTRDALRGIRVFLVDDDPDAREVVQIALNHAGAQVHAFGSGSDLLRAWRDSIPSAIPTVLLLDIAMPDEDGFGVLKRFRELGGASFVPVIAVTALTYLDRQQFVASGFQDSIGKPVDIDRLIDAIVLCAGRKEPGPRSELICLS